MKHTGKAAITAVAPVKNGFRIGNCASAVRHVKPTKRVTFGQSDNGDDVVKQTFVYETSSNNVSTADAYNGRQKPPAGEPPSVVTVRSGVSPLPQSIRPPSLVDSASAGTNSARAECSVTFEHGAVVMSVPLGHKADDTALSDSPHENPFRPADALWHEVEPIVDAYKTRPFPQSPRSELLHELHANEQEAAQRQQCDNAHEQGGQCDGRPQCRSEEPAEGDQLLPATKHTEPVQLSADTVDGANGHNHQQQQQQQAQAEHQSPAKQAPGSKVQPVANGQNQVDVNRTTIPPATAAKAEMVHVQEKKPKCGGCCSFL